MQQYRPRGFNILPTAVKNILIINGLFFLATFSLGSTFGIDLSNSMGLHYVGSDQFKPFQFITHLFMHGNFMHIFSNMFALWMFGSVLENTWGTKRFLIFYFVTGLGAALIHSSVLGIEFYMINDALEAYRQSPSVETFSLFMKDRFPEFLTGDIQNFMYQWSNTPESASFQEESVQTLEAITRFKENIPTVGASGAVFGLLAGFGMMFPNTLIYLYFFFPIRAKYFVIGYAALELYAGFQDNPGDNVAHFAHLGGALVGYILVRVWKKDRKNFF